MEYKTFFQSSFPVTETTDESFEELKKTDRKLKLKTHRHSLARILAFLVLLNFHLRFSTSIVHMKMLSNS